MNKLARQVQLSELIKVHYGKALKSNERDESGCCIVFGSSGMVGRHTSATVSHPTLVIGRKGSVGEVTFAPDGGWPIDTTFYTETVDDGQIDLRYLFYALRRANLARHTITTSIPGLSRDDIYKTKIPVPSLPEQRRIAAILDKADAIRRKRQEAIKLTEEFLRSVFLDMFGDPVTNPKGWEVVTLDQLMNFRTGKLDSNAAVEGGEFPFFTCAREMSWIDKYTFDCEALLLAGNNATADYSVKYYRGKFNAYQRTYVITLKDPAHSYHHMKHALELKLQELKRFSRGTNTKYLTLGILHALSLQVPPSEKQMKFAHIQHEVDKSLKLREEALKDSIDLFDSVVQRAFSVGF